MAPHLSRRDLVAGACASGLLAGCASRSPEAPENVAPSVFATTPENQAATFRNADRLAAVRTIRRGKRTRLLRSHRRSAAGLRYDFAGATYTIDDYMARNHTAGLLVLKRGEIALERYGMGNTERSRWTSFSTAKSVTATLAGAALQAGAIKSLDDPAERYVPELRGCAYEGVTVRNILRMCSGVGWVEKYVTSGESDIARLGAALRENRPGALMELMRSRPRVAEQGTRFNYSTGETFVLGAIVAGATKMPLADFCSQVIWSPAGMEEDGYWQLEAQGGREIAGIGISATLRDYARFGQFILENGEARGTRVLPAGWRELAGQPDTAATAHGRIADNYPLGYGYQWWALPLGQSALPNHDGAFTTQGIFGQFVYVNPKEDFVAVVWNAWRAPWTIEGELETYSLLGVAVEYSR